MSTTSDPALIQVPRSMWRFLWLFAALGFLVMAAGDVCAIYFARVIAERPDPVLLAPDAKVKP